MNHKRRSPTSTDAGDQHHNEVWPSIGEVATDLFALSRTRSPARSPRAHGRAPTEPPVPCGAGGDVEALRLLASVVSNVTDACEPSSVLGDASNRSPVPSGSPAGDMHFRVLPVRVQTLSPLSVPNVGRLHSARIRRKEIDKASNNTGGTHMSIRKAHCDALRRSFEKKPSTVLDAVHPGWRSDPRMAPILNYWGLSKILNSRGSRKTRKVNEKPSCAPKGDPKTVVARVGSENVAPPEELQSVAREDPEAPPPGRACVAQLAAHTLPASAEAPSESNGDIMEFLPIARAVVTAETDISTVEGACPVHAVGGPTVVEETGVETGRSTTVGSTVPFNVPRFVSKLMDVICGLHTDELGPLMECAQHFVAAPTTPPEDKENVVRILGSYKAGTPGAAILDSLAKVVSLGHDRERAAKMLGLFQSNLRSILNVGTENTTIPTLTRFVGGLFARVVTSTNGLDHLARWCGAERGMDCRGVLNLLVENGSDRDELTRAMRVFLAPTSASSYVWIEEQTASGGWLHSLGDPLLPSIGHVFTGNARNPKAVWSGWCDVATLCSRLAGTTAIPIVAFAVITEASTPKILGHASASNEVLRLACTSLFAWTVNLPKTAERRVDLLHTISKWSGRRIATLRARDRGQLVRGAFRDVAKTVDAASLDEAVRLLDRTFVPFGNWSFFDALESH